jgi:hypothetical protein
MRLRSIALPVFVPVVFAIGVSTVTMRDPQGVNIVAACNPSGNPSVQPLKREMKRADHVEWRESAKKATSWMITPKDPANWPFADTIRGNQNSPANSLTPAAGAPAGVPFGYEVTIFCTDGRVQHIDPEIVIVD